MERSVEFSELCNGSFQNQTTSCFPSGKSAASRKRGIAAALQDATNIVYTTISTQMNLCRMKWAIGTGVALIFIFL